MWMANMWKLIVLVVFLNVLHLGFGLRCYECDTVKEPGCTAQLGVAPASNECGTALPGGHNGHLYERLLLLRRAGVSDHKDDSVDYNCIVISATNEHGNVMTGRGCAVSQYSCDTALKQLQNLNLKSVKCHSCNTDLCNGSLE